MSIYVFDTETTDKSETAEIIEAAALRIRAAPDLLGGTDSIPEVLYFDERIHGRYKPSKPLTFGSMAVHHILPAELDDCPPSSSFRLPEDCTYLVGHSIDHDWRAIGSPPGVKRICTDAMARWTWPDADGYSQTALLYMVLGARPETRELVRGAHSAIVDAANNLRLLRAILDKLPDVRTWSQLWDYSEKCREPRTCRFKRYSDMALTDLPLDFVDWVLRQSWISVYERRAYQRVWDAACAPIDRFDEDDQEPAPAVPATETATAEDSDDDGIPF